MEHYGVVQDGVEDTSSAEAAGWAGGQEAYTLRQKDGSTEVLVDVDTHDDYKDMFSDMWPRALQKLKQISEN